MSEQAAVYRVKYGVSFSPNGSGGDWRYYEDVGRMKRDLLDAYLDSRGLHGKERVHGTAGFLIESWRRFWNGSDKDYPRVSRIFEVARFDGGEWVPLVVEFVEPAVVLRGESDD